MSGSKKRKHNKSTGRDYTYDKKYQSSEEQKKRRAARNKDRQKALRDGRVKKGDNKDVHHVDNNPMNHKASNVRVVGRSKNRAIK